MTRKSNEEKTEVSSEDIAIFREAISGVRVLAAEPRAPSKSNKELKRVVKGQMAQRLDMDVNNSIHPKPRSHSQGIKTDSDNGQGHVVFARSGIQQKRINKLKKGGYPVQATLDLHGSKSHEVDSRLETFMSESLELNYRCLLVIYGKGFHSAERKSVIRPLTHTWLKNHSEVLAYCSAQSKHGGTGAAYVLLREPLQKSERVRLG